MLTTSRRGVSYPNPDRSDRADIALHIGNIAAAVDVDTLFNQGTDAARLAAAHQNGGGRFWWTTDTALLWYDDGTAWRSLTPPTTTLSGLLSARPAANTVSAGTTYFATDQVVQYFSDGATWTRTGIPAGATVDWFKPDAAVPTGWVLYDGSNLPAATGIYADLYLHLGNTLTKPDTRGRFTTGLGTNSDVSAIGVNDGLAVASRSPKHNSTPTLSLPNHIHAFSDPGHSHAAGGLSINPGGGIGIGVGTGNIGTAADTSSGGPVLGSTAGAYTGSSVGNPTSNPAIAGTIGPGGTRPTDTGAFIVCAKIAKL
jgi:hypothetical protein